MLENHQNEVLVQAKLRKLPPTCFSSTAPLHLPVSLYSTTTLSTPCSLLNSEWWSGQTVVLPRRSTAHIPNPLLSGLFTTLHYWALQFSISCPLIKRVGMSFAEARQRSCGNPPPIHEILIPGSFEHVTMCVYYTPPPLAPSNSPQVSLPQLLPSVMSSSYLLTFVINNPQSLLGAAHMSVCGHPVRHEQLPGSHMSREE